MFPGLWTVWNQHCLRCLVGSAGNQNVRAEASSTPAIFHFLATTSTHLVAENKAFQGVCFLFKMCTVPCVIEASTFTCFDWYPTQWPQVISITTYQLNVCDHLSSRLAWRAAKPPHICVANFTLPPLPGPTSLNSNKLWEQHTICQRQRQPAHASSQSNILVHDRWCVVG